MRKLGMVIVVVGLIAFVAPAWAGDGYGKKQKGDYAKCACPSNTARTVAWCGACKAGVAFGHKVKSEKLVAALAGHEVKPDGMKCGGCQKVYITPRSICGPCYRPIDEFVEVGPLGTLEALMQVPIRRIDSDTDGLPLLLSVFALVSRRRFSFLRIGAASGCG